MIASVTAMTSSHCAAMQMSLIIGTLLAARSLAVNFVDNIAANGNTVVARRYFANITIINIIIIVRWGASTEFAGVSVSARIVISILPI